jgi:hypothetical protein
MRKAFISSQLEYFLQKKIVLIQLWRFSVSYYLNFLIYWEVNVYRVIHSNHGANNESMNNLVTIMIFNK